MGYWGGTIPWGWGGGGDQERATRTHIYKKICHTRFYEVALIHVLKLLPDLCWVFWYTPSPRLKPFSLQKTVDPAWLCVRDKARLQTSAPSILNRVSYHEYTRNCPWMKHSPPSLWKTGQRIVQLLLPHIDLMATTKPNISTPRSPLAASWSEICSISVSETKGWKAFFTVDFNSTKGAVAWDFWDGVILRCPSEPRWLVLFFCTAMYHRRGIILNMDNIFSVLDSTRKTVAMSQESGFRWGDNGDTLTRHVTPVTPIRVTPAPMAKCNSSTVDMEFWRFANEPWMSPGGWILQSQGQNLQKTEDHLYRFRHASTGVIYPARLGLCSEQSFQKVLFVYSKCFNSSFICFTINLSDKNQSDGNDGKNQTEFSRTKRTLQKTRHFLTTGCSLQHEHYSELALYPKIRLY